MNEIKLRRPLTKKTGDTVWIHSEGRTFAISTRRTSTTGSEPVGEASDGLVVSPMPGKILKINVSENQKIKIGETVCVLEAMKMEYSVKAPMTGSVIKVYKKAGDPVALEEKILEMK